jgi:hypothetical protein
MLTSNRTTFPSQKAVTQERIKPHQHEVLEEQITRETHVHDVYHEIQPIIEREVRPAKHFIPTEDGGLREVAAEDLSEGSADNVPPGVFEGEGGQEVRKRTAGMTTKSLQGQAQSQSQPSSSRTAPVPVRSAPTLMPAEESLRGIMSASAPAASSGSASGSKTSAGAGTASKTVTGNGNGAATGSKTLTGAGNGAATGSKTVTGTGNGAATGGVTRSVIVVEEREDSKVKSKRRSIAEKLGFHSSSASSSSKKH